MYLNLTRRHNAVPRILFVRKNRRLGRGTLQRSRSRLARDASSGILPGSLETSPFYSTMLIFLYVRYSSEPGGTPDKTTLAGRERGHRVSARLIKKLPGNHLNPITQSKHINTTNKRRLYQCLTILISDHLRK